jgi:polysaccharide pyruvyl transferase WcaK-like protein
MEGSMRTKLISYEYQHIPIEPYGMTAPDYNGANLMHVAIHDSLNQNAGDTLLPRATRRVFDFLGGSYGWYLKQVWEEFTPEDLELCREKARGLIVGGGGFMIVDQEGGDTGHSGWLWNLPLAMLEDLDKPIILFGVGYNRFRRQADFSDKFIHHINKLAGKAAFIGLRNTGSVQAVKGYLKDQALKDKISLQYCPTTAAWQIFPQKAALAQEHDRNKTDKRTLAFNFAFDRPFMRFGERVEPLMNDMARVMLTAQKEGWDIILVSHKTIDRTIEPFLDKYDVKYLTHDLTGADYNRIMDFYAGIDLAVGMRGHSQLIPFGLRRKIISIISHDKMRFFLDDIKRPEWGVDVEKDDFVDRLTEKIRFFGLQEEDATQSKINAAQESVWNHTRDNVNRIMAML